MLNVQSFIPQPSYLNLHLHLQPQNPTLQMLEEELKSLFRNHLASVYLVHDTRAVDSYLARYRTLKTQLMDTYDILASQAVRLGKPRMPLVKIRPTRWGPWAVELCEGATTPTKVPKVAFQLGRLAQLRKQVLQQQNLALALSMAAAFATFTYVCVYGGMLVVVCAWWVVYTW